MRVPWWAFCWAYKAVFRHFAENWLKMEAAVPAELFCAIIDVESCALSFCPGWEIFHPGQLASRKPYGFLVRARALTISSAGPAWRPEGRRIWDGGGMPWNLAIRAGGPSGGFG